MKISLDIKTLFKSLSLAGFFLFGMGKAGFAGPCSPSLPFSDVLSFDRQANGQIVSLQDCNRDGLADYQASWTVVEFTEAPLACADPFDPRHLIVPRSGFYRILAEPVRVVVLPGREEGAVPDSRSFQQGGRW